MLLVLVLLLVLLYALLQSPRVQTWLVKKVAKNLSEKLQTNVTVKRVDFRFFNQLILEGLMVEDRKKDTLVFAGKAKANVNDWFIFKDNISLENIDLADAVVNMNRTDSVWNYQFLVDYFADTSASTGNKKKIEIDLKQVHFSNIRFNKIDKWIGQNQIVSIKKMDLEMYTLNLTRKTAAIKELYLEQPYFAQSEYDGNRPPSPDIKNVLEQTPILQAFKWNNSGWVVNAEKLKIVNGSFQNDKHTERAPLEYFDGMHILFSGINGTLQNVLFLNDTLSAKVDLSAKEHSGFEVKKLQSNMRFTPELMEFNNLDLQTNKSRLGNYYAMRYNKFNYDMGRFISKVTLNADFKESVLNSDDLAFFAPALKNWKRVFNIEGNVKGTVDDFTAKNLKIRSGSSYLDGNLGMTGLPDINSTFIDLKANTLQTNYNDLALIIPAIKKNPTPAFNKLGIINYKGTFTGFPMDFVAYGNFQTALGSATTDVNMKLQPGKDPVYSGRVNTDGFNLGAFLNNAKLGMVALNAELKGNSFSLNDLDAKIKGRVHRFDYGGYSYRNIGLDGGIQNKYFKGKFSADDPNIKVSELFGSVNLASKVPFLSADAKVEYINLKNLGLSKDNLRLSGIFNLNFKGDNIDNFLGSARIYSATLFKDSTKMSFDSLTLVSLIDGNDKVLTLESNEVQARLRGQFKVMELPDAFTFFLAKYYPAYFKAPKKLSEQNFSFDVQTKNVDDYVHLFNPKLSGFNNADLRGNINLRNYELNLEASVPGFMYDGKSFDNTTLIAKGNRDTLYAVMDVANIKINDSLQLPGTKINLAASNNASVINLTTTANKSIRDAELNATVHHMEDGVRIHFAPSSFILNDKKWRLEKDGEITLRKRYFDANEVKFVHGNQQIILSSEMDPVRESSNLVARLENINIEDFAPFVITKPSMKGVLTGKATIADPFGKPVIEFNGKADSFYLDGKEVGNVNLDANANTNTGLVSFNGTGSGSNNDFTVNGTVNYKDSSGAQTDIAFKANKFDLNILEPYMNTVFSQVKGIATGDIRLYNDKKNMYITGPARISNGSLTVAYTKCKYLLNDQLVNFGKDLIELKTIRIKDTLGNEGTVNGKIHHRFFRDFDFEGIRVETQKMLVLNTTRADNSQYYGKVIGSALMTLDGPTTDMYMNISGQPSLFDTSHVYLLTGDGKESNKVDYIDFIKFGNEMNDTKSSQASSLTVNLNLVANDQCKIDVILDEETGDIIKGEGNGRLNIVYATGQDLFMRGKYELTKGEYTFNFQTFIKKPFELRPGGSITWNGNPYNASIDIEAGYLAKNVDVSTLSAAASYRLKEDVNIISHLTGSLKKPDISFEFDLPERSPLRKDYIVMKKLEDYRNDPNSMNKQVASLLLFNSFMSEESFFSQQNTLGLATSTIGGMLSNWLVNTLNRELERVTGGKISFDLDINPTFDLQNPANQLQANVRGRLKLTPGKRFVVYLGGNLDYNNPYFIQRKGLFTPDLSVEYLLRADGSLRLVGFNRTSTDFTTGQRNRSGLQVSYRKDVDKLGDLFKSSKRIEEEKAKENAGTGSN
ncbi:MAG: translocation/assembly module TamB domain-containing protein [Ferruginibacter sp.]